MQTLVNRDSYAEIEEKFWKRARKIVGVLFGVVMCAASVIQQASVLGFGLSLSVGLVVGALSGVCFGWLWFWAMRRSARKYSDRVYEGDPSVVGQVPRNRQYAYRVPCSLFVTNNVAIGGVLYLGRSGARFVPNRRHRDEPEMEFPPEGLVVWAVDWRPNWWGRTFVASGPQVLEVASGNTRRRFAFPDVNVVVPRIREALGQ